MMLPDDYGRWIGREIVGYAVTGSTFVLMMKGGVCLDFKVKPGGVVGNQGGRLDYLIGNKITDISVDDHGGARRYFFLYFDAGDNYEDELRIEGPLCGVGPLTLNVP